MDRDDWLHVGVILLLVVTAAITIDLIGFFAATSAEHMNYCLEHVGVRICTIIVAK